MKLQVVLTPESVGGYSASVPALPGCYSEGETLDETLDNIREAAELWLEAKAARYSMLNGPVSCGNLLQEIEL